MARIPYPIAGGADTKTSGGASDRGNILPSLGITGISFDVFEEIIREIQRSVHVAMHSDSSPRNPGDKPRPRSPYHIFKTLDPMAKKEGLGTFYKRKFHAAMGGGRMEEICSKFGVKRTDHKLVARVQAHARLDDQEGKMMTRERKAVESQQSPSSKEPKHDQGDTTTIDEKFSSSDSGGDFGKECHGSKETVKQHLSVDKMREILKIKEQRYNSRVSLLFFGPPNECVTCNTNLKIDGEQYRCYGFCSEWCNCTFKIRNPPRKKEETKLIDSVHNSPVDELLEEHREIRVLEGYLLLYYRNSKLGSEKEAENRLEEKGNADDAINVGILLQRALRGEEGKNVEIKLMTFDYEHQKKAIFVVVNACCSKDHMNNIVGVCFVGQDVTGQKVVIDKFIYIQGDYKAIVHSPNALIPPVFASDENTCCLEWNMAMERVTGWTRDEIVGKLLVGEVFGSSCQLKGLEALTKFMIVLHNAIGGQDTDKFPFSFYDRNGKFVGGPLTANKRVNMEGQIIGEFCFLQIASLELQQKQPMVASLMQVLCNQGTNWYAPREIFSAHGSVPKLLTSEEPTFPLYAVHDIRRGVG